jgi:pimeloyl-ACP methyl ester carboxylesterase
MFGPGFRTSPEGRAVIDEWVAMLGHSDRAGIARAVRGVLNRPAVAPELGRISAPTLVATGEHDKPTPPHRGRRIAAAVPGARFELIPGAGHSSSLEQPAAVTTLVRDFVSTH